MRIGGWESTGEGRDLVDTRGAVFRHCLAAADGASPVSTDRLVQERYVWSHGLAVEVKAYRALRVGRVGFYTGPL